MISPDRRILILWAIALGLITWRELKAPAADATLPGLPRPWAYSRASVAFIAAAIVGEVNGQLGTMLALGWVVAIYLGYFGAHGITPTTVGASGNRSQGVTTP